MSGQVHERLHADLIGQGGALDGDGLSSEVARLAAWLREAGIGSVAWDLDNGIDWIVIDLACLAAGVTAVPLAGYFTDSQCDYAIEDSGAELVVLARSRSFATLTDAAVVAGLPDRLAAYRVYRRGGAGTTRLERVAKITSTSGTTGRPKGVCLSQRTLDRVAASLLAATRPLELASHLCLLPLATLLENVAGVQAPLAGGMRVTVPSLADVGLVGGAGFDVARCLSALNRYRPDSVILLPQMLLALVAALEQGASMPPNLRFIAVGGARVPIALLARAERLGLPVFEGYGLSECASVVALNRPGAQRPGSVGQPLPHARVRIANDGEILVAGATMHGYLGSAPVAAGEEIATGDLGHFDDDGFLYVHGRKKNVFITSFGRNVSPEWVEAELTATGAILQAVVFGESQPFNVALLVPAAGADRTHAVRRAVERANAVLPDYARISSWLVADEPWTAANGFATANGRPRRDAILSANASRLEARLATLA